jgi:WD40 repeat protein
MASSPVPALLCGILLLSLALPAACAVTPLWIEPASVGGELFGVVISADGKTIVAGGDQLISLTADGRKRWTGFSGTCIAVSSTGDYILSSQGQILRLISAGGTLVWDESMDIPVTDLSMAPDASVIAAAGGGRVRVLTSSGESIAANASMAVNHIRVMPSGDQILLTTNRNIQLSNRTLLPSWEDTNWSQDLVETASDGSLFVTATDNRVRMYSGKGTLLWEKRFPSGNAKALALSRDGSTIVTGMDDSTVHVMNRQGAEVFSAGAGNWITSVAVSDNGNTIAFGSMDKKVYVYNHAGVKMGSFTTKNAIRFNSVAVSGDGSLIVVVDDSAVYGLSRESFALEGTMEQTLQAPSPEPSAEITALPVPLTTVRKVSTTHQPLPTPYPVTSETPEAPLPAPVALAALGFLIIVRIPRP